LKLRSTDTRVLERHQSGARRLRAAVEACRNRSATAWTGTHAPLGASSKPIGSETIPIGSFATTTHGQLISCSSRRPGPWRPVGANRTVSCRKGRQGAAQLLESGSDP
jgi:hypothetical protein